ncbi:trimeric intracellular cation channel family protein [Veillonella sp. 3310]|jgi:predicted membrane protein|uniref:trimeric intracellular cation channel family protein n=1 Tax=Veillonella sp. 3310 TaxID=2490956 RepID=UPI000FD68AA1|nr:trimeric intracellular cation channel family protein [Veillonella sp. 3310]
MDFLWLLFDVIGTIAFAISGALLGVQRRMDIFGILILALVTAIGGGIVRDVMVGRIPPTSLQTGLYISITLITVGIIFIMYRYGWNRYIEGKGATKVYLTADALGLASFTVTGATIGITVDPGNLVLTVVLGVITAVGGGIIRDILAHRTPSVLKEEVYALPALLGSIIYYVVCGIGHQIMASYATFLIVFIIRMVALEYHWNLPRIDRIHR